MPSGSKLRGLALKQGTTTFNIPYINPKVFLLPKRCLCRQKTQHYGGNQNSSSFSSTEAKAHSLAPNQVYFLRGKFFFRQASDCCSSKGWEILTPPRGNRLCPIPSTLIAFLSSQKWGRFELPIGSLVFKMEEDPNRHKCSRGGRCCPLRTHSPPLLD